MSAPKYPGHRVRLQHAFVAFCECGWASATHMTKGARAEALAEWEVHAFKCRAALSVTKEGAES